MAAKPGILWDMDGVLVDTGQFHFQAWSQTLAERGLSISYEFFRTTFGMNNADLLANLLQEPSPDLVADLGDQKEALFRQVIRGRAELLPGARFWLERLASQGVRQAIASSAPPANVEALVRELALEPYFAAVVSGVGMPGKPDPAVFLRAARLIDTPPERCIVIEDAMAGVEAARRAGMKCIAVTTTNSAGELQAADLVVERLDHLPLDTFEKL